MEHKAQYFRKSALSGVFIWQLYECLAMHLALGQQFDRDVIANASLTIAAEQGAQLSLRDFFRQIFQKQFAGRSAWLPVLKARDLFDF